RPEPRDVEVEPGPVAHAQDQAGEEPLPARGAGKAPDAARRASTPGGRGGAGGPPLVDARDGTTLEPLGSELVPGIVPEGEAAGDAAGVLRRRQVEGELEGGDAEPGGVRRRRQRRRRGRKVAGGGGRDRHEPLRPQGVLREAPRRQAQEEEDAGRVAGPGGELPGVLRGRDTPAQEGQEREEEGQGEGGEVLREEE
ncbi:hypothetical protein THAOC_19350, partial [Thalassiosira oceanica]